jgi:diguanylate cyclase (GGDEF)-like protein/PAS domain S-box-containing protein
MSSAHVFNMQGNYVQPGCSLLNCKRMGNADKVLERGEERTTSAILRSESNLRHMLDASPFPIIVCGRDSGNMLYINRLAAGLFGYTLDELRGKPAPSYFVNRGDREHLHELLIKQRSVEDFETVLKDAGGRQFYAQVSASLVEYEGEPAVFLSFSDITRRKEIENELMRLAATDSLTGLLNRRAFFEHGEREVARARRNGKPLCLLMLDLDNFKLVNDTHGHAAGDEVLRNMAETMQNALRETDLLGRVGGEEFAAILPEAALAGATDTAERLRKAIEARATVCNGRKIYVTASIGVSQFQAPDEQLDEVLKRADQAMYKAKSKGRNRVSAE